MSYAIYWYVGEVGPRYAGRLELTDCSVELSGSAHGHRFLDSTFFDEIASIRLSARNLRISRRKRGELDIGSVDGPGSLRELGDCLALALRERTSSALNAG